MLCLFFISVSVLWSVRQHRLHMQRFSDENEPGTVHSALLKRRRRDWISWGDLGFVWETSTFNSYSPLTHKHTHSADDDWDPCVDVLDNLDLESCLFYLPHTIFILISLVNLNHSSCFRELITAFMFLESVRNLFLSL